MHAAQLKRTGLTPAEVAQADTTQHVISSHTKLLIGAMIRWLSVRISERAAAVNLGNTPHSASSINQKTRVQCQSPALDM